MQLVIEEKIKSLEKSGSDLVPEYIVQIDKIPDLAMQYAQMMLNLEIEKKIIEYLYPQFELAKLEEVKDLPTLRFMMHLNWQSSGLNPKEL